MNYRPTKEEIELMDNILSKMSMHDDMCEHTVTHDEEDEAKNLIIEFANFHPIGKLIERGQCLRYDINTKRFIDSGGFHVHFENLDNQIREEKQRQARKDKLERLSLIKLQIWFWLFLASLAANLIQIFWS